MSWHERANCRDVTPALFFAAEGESRATRTARLSTAKGICARCEVVDECAEYARSTQVSYGVWGGQDEKERRRGDIDLRCRWCRERFVWSWAPSGQPWYCGDTCRRAAQKHASKLRNQRHRGAPEGITA